MPVFILSYGLVNWTILLQLWCNQKALSIWRKTTLLFNRSSWRYLHKTVGMFVVTDRNPGACGLNFPTVAIRMEGELDKEPDYSNHYCSLCKCKCVLQVTCKKRREKKKRKKPEKNSFVSICLSGNVFNSSHKLESDSVVWYVCTKGFSCHFRCTHLLRKLSLKTWGLKAKEGRLQGLCYDDHFVSFYIFNFTMTSLFYFLFEYTFEY